VSKKQYLRKQATADRYGINVRTLERWVKGGLLPRPVYFGRTPGWDCAALDKAERAALVASRAKVEAA
jgi:predicted DNA-binding transcriptional regulator AlpA